MSEIDKVQKEIDSIFKNGKVGSGYQVSYFHKGVLTTYNSGYYDFNFAKKIKKESLFDLASITKLYTSTLILMAHDSRKINVNDKVGKYLDNFKHSNLTILDLATHRVDFGVSLGFLRKRSLFRKHLEDKIVKLNTPKTNLLHTNYNNLGYIYLGKILEHIERKDLNSIYLDFFNSCGLNNTSTGKKIKTNNINTPTTERVLFKNIKNCTHDETARALGGIAGHAGIFSNSEDVVNFIRNIFDEVYYSKETLERVVKVTYDKNKPQSFGFWLRIPEVSNYTEGIYSHTGYTGGFTAKNINNGRIVCFNTNRVLISRNNKEHIKIWKLLYSWIEGNS